MPEENPIDPILSELGDLMNLFFEKKDHGFAGEIPPEIYDRLLTAAIQIHALRESMENTLKEEEISEEELKEIIANPPPTMDPKNKRVLEKATKMKREISAIYRVLRSHEEEKPGKKKHKTIFKKGDKAKKAEKNLQIGFRKGWKRL